MLRQLANSLVSQGHGSQAGAWYLFGLSGLTIFLLAIVLVGGFASEHEFQTVLKIRTRASSWRLNGTVTPAQITRELTDDSSLNEALAKAGYFAVVAAEDTSRAQALSDVLRQLHVAVRHDTSGALQVQIRYRAADPALAAAVVNHLANEYAGRFRERIDRDLLTRYMQAREQAEDARRVVSQCEAEVEKFLEQVFPRSVVQQHPADSQQSSQQAHPYAVVLASAEVAVTDVGYLKDQLLELQRQRFELLKTRTPAHPAVQELEKDIATTSQRLEEAEEKLTTPVGQPLVDDTQAQATAAEVRALSSELEKMLADHRQAARTFYLYRTRLERYLSQLTAAEEAEQSAWRTHREVRATPLVAWSPAAGERTLNRSRWRTTASLSLFTALAAATGLTWLSGIAWRTYVSPAQWQAELGIPLAAVLRTDRRLNWSPRAMLRQVLGGWRIFCEVMLVVGSVWVVSLCIAESGFAAEFVQDPLGQLAGTMHRVAGLVSR